MSGTALVVEALPNGDAAMSSWLEVLGAHADAGTGLDADRITDTAAVDAVRRLGIVEAKLAATKLALIAAVDRANAARRATGATSTAAWLRSEGMTASAANRQVALAGALVNNEATREALQAGRISADQAGVIVGALDSLSDAVDEQTKTTAESRLLGQAERLDPWQLGKEAKAQAARIDPAGAGNLARDEAAARAQRALWISKGADGMHHLRGLLDTEGAAHLLNALDPFARPRSSKTDGPDTRSPERRRADALIELAQLAARTQALPDTGGTKTTVIVTIPVQVLTGATEGAALIQAGTLTEPISAQTARKIACDAAIIPAVLGTRSEILDLGRAARLASPAQRQALALRDGGCAFPGCDRPPGWCIAHHIVPWSAGGRTDLDNLVLLCGNHHDLIHHDEWTVTLDPDRRPQFEPPYVPPPEPPPF